MPIDFDGMIDCGARFAVSVNRSLVDESFTGHVENSNRSITIYRLLERELA